MTALLEAAWEVHCFMLSHRIPYVIIGGLALQYWGEPRFTRDVDVMAAVPLEEADAFVQLVVTRLASRVADPIAFARRTWMILVKAPTAVKSISRWVFPAMKTTSWSGPLTMSWKQANKFAFAQPLPERFELPWRKFHRGEDPSLL